MTNRMSSSDGISANQPETYIRCLENGTSILYLLEEIGYFCWDPELLLSHFNFYGANVN